MSSPNFGTPEGTRFHFLLQAEENRGINSVKPELINTPVGCCIAFSSPKAKQKWEITNVISPFWHAGRDSNPQPSEPESDALSIEPPAHVQQTRLL